jgi:hypothetical protein
MSPRARLRACVCFGCEKYVSSGIVERGRDSSHELPQPNPSNNLIFSHLPLDSPIRRPPMYKTENPSSSISSAIVQQRRAKFTSSLEAWSISCCVQQTYSWNSSAIGCVVEYSGNSGVYIWVCSQVLARALEQAQELRNWDFGFSFGVVRTAACS